MKTRNFAVMGMGILVKRIITLSTHWKRHEAEVAAEKIRKCGYRMVYITKTPR